MLPTDSSRPSWLPDNAVSGLRRGRFAQHEGHASPIARRSQRFAKPLRGFRAAISIVIISRIDAGETDVPLILSDPNLEFRAKETRELASQETNPATKEWLLMVAAEYERLAKRAKSRDGTHDCE